MIKVINYFGVMVLLPFFIFALLFKFIERTLTGRKIFYTSIRLGKDQVPFKMYKFCTMRAWTPEEFDDYLVTNPEALKEWIQNKKLKDDPRRTKIGMFLRKSSIDELPQIINILKGDMSLIGPRPIVKAEDIYYGKRSDILHSINPGLTGLWQISGRNLTTYQRRIAINLYYIKHRTLSLDIWILYKTIWAVIGCVGAY